MSYKKLRIAELAFWPFIVMGIALLIATSDYRRDLEAGVEVVMWYPFYREIMSGLVWLALIPLINWTLKRWSINRLGLIWFLVLHIPLGIIFISVRNLVALTLHALPWTLQGFSFNYGIIISAIPGEYAENTIVYVFILSILAGYHWLRPDLTSRTFSEFEDDEILNLPYKAGIKRVPLGDVEWIEAARNYVVFHAGGIEYMLRTTHGRIENTLEEKGFIRTHRSSLVNINHVLTVSLNDNGERCVELKSGKVLPLARKHQTDFLEALKEKDILL